MSSEMKGFRPASMFERSADVSPPHSESEELIPLSHSEDAESLIHQPFAPPRKLRRNKCIGTTFLILFMGYMVYSELRMRSVQSRVEDTFDAVDQLRDASYDDTTRDLVGHIDPGVQMSRHQIARIIDLLNRSEKDTGDSPTYLVFGFGNDSPFWASLTNGRTVFIEDNPTWFNMMYSKLNVEAYLVSYSTHTRNDYDLYVSTDMWPRLYMHNLPANVTNTKWDVILVDAPAGQSPYSVGRYQSLYMAKQLVREGGFVIVDDCQRPVERRYSNLMLGYDNRIGVVTRDDRTSATMKNEQCYFKL